MAATALFGAATGAMAQWTYNPGLSASITHPDGWEIIVSEDIIGNGPSELMIGECIAEPSTPKVLNLNQPISGGYVITATTPSGIFGWNDGGTVGLDKLAGLILPDTLKRIESSSFSDESFQGVSHSVWTQRTLVIPDSVTDIGSMAFRNLIEDLASQDEYAIDSITIGAGVEYIDTYAFWNIRPLDIYFRGTPPVLEDGTSLPIRANISGNAQLPNANVYVLRDMGWEGLVDSGSLEQGDAVILFKTGGVSYGGAGYGYVGYWTPQSQEPEYAWYLVDNGSGTFSLTNAFGWKFDVAPDTVTGEIIVGGNQNNNFFGGGPLDFSGAIHHATPPLNGGEYRIVEIDGGGASIFPAIMAPRVESLVLPDTLVAIGVQVFSGCECTGDLVIPASVEYIGTMAFLDCQFDAVYFMGPYSEDFGEGLYHPTDMDPMYRYDDIPTYITVEHAASWLASGEIYGIPSPAQALADGTAMWRGNYNGGGQILCPGYVNASEYAWYLVYDNNTGYSITNAVGWEFAVIPSAGDGELTVQGAIRYPVTPDLLDFSGAIHDGGYPPSNGGDYKIVAFDNSGPCLFHAALGGVTGLVLPETVISIGVRFFAGLDNCTGDLVIPASVEFIDDGAFGGFTAGPYNYSGAEFDAVYFEGAYPFLGTDLYDYATIPTYITVEHAAGWLASGEIFGSPSPGKALENGTATWRDGGAIYCPGYVHVQQKWTDRRDGTWPNIGGDHGHIVGGLYVISTEEQLAQFAYLVAEGDTFGGKTVVLAADLDMSGYFWEGIGRDGTTPFAGTFDGRGRSINGLNGDSGLFAVGIRNGARVRDVVVSGTIVSDLHIVGGITSSTSTGAVIDGCSFAGSILGSGEHVGGIVGLHSDSSMIVNCENTASVSVQGKADAASFDFRVGGIAGSVNSSAQIINCRNAGSVTAAACNPPSATEHLRAGGIAGLVSGGSFDVGVKNCYNSGTVTTTGSVSGNNHCGGLAGSVQGIAHITSCYWKTGGASYPQNAIGGNYLGQTVTIISTVYSFTTPPGTVSVTDDLLDLLTGFVVANATYNGVTLWKWTLVGSLDGYPVFFPRPVWVPDLTDGAGDDDWFIITTGDSDDLSLPKELDDTDPLYVEDGHLVEVEPGNDIDHTTDDSGKYKYRVPNLRNFPHPQNRYIFDPSKPGIWVIEDDGNGGITTNAFINVPDGTVDVFDPNTGDKSEFWVPDPNDYGEYFVFDYDDDTWDFPSGYQEGPIGDEYGDNLVDVQPGTLIGHTDETKDGYEPPFVVPEVPLFPYDGGTDNGGHDYVFVPDIPAVIVIDDQGNVVAIIDVPSGAITIIDGQDGDWYYIPDTSDGAGPGDYFKIRKGNNAFHPGVKFPGKDWTDIEPGVVIEHEPDGDGYPFIVPELPGFPPQPAHNLQNLRNHYHYEFDPSIPAVLVIDAISPKTNAVIHIPDGTVDILDPETGDTLEFWVPDPNNPGEYFVFDYDDDTWDFPSKHQGTHGGKYGKNLVDVAPGTVIGHTDDGEEGYPFEVSEIPEFPYNGGEGEGYDYVFVPDLPAVIVIDRDTGEVVAVIDVPTGDVEYKTAAEEWVNVTDIKVNLLTGNALLTLDNATVAARLGPVFTYVIYATTDLTQPFTLWTPHDEDVHFGVARGGPAHVATMATQNEPQMFFKVKAVRTVTP
ncbi:MAG: leucine-rich repeat domain-containing protein [Kiritimatiellaeota bacterium]|nr:leucine-rich repeat domain-containing protein [Kiritimatiellota bacterium]